MNEVGKNREDVGEDVGTGKCPGCGSEDLVLTLETSKGFRYKCSNCDETFVVETRLFGENIKALTQIPKMTNEIDERKTIKIPKKTYMQLESIRQDIGLTTLIDANAYVVNEYKGRKEFEAKILQVISEAGEKTVNLMNTFWADIQKDINEIKTQIKELNKDKTLEWKPRT
jgi:transcription elongation factor Elf1